MMGVWFADQVDRHLADLDEGWEQEAEEWHRTEESTDYLRHNLQWMNTLHWIKYPHLYL